MKFIVTGGCGYIGSRIVESLLDNGHEVIILDDFSSNFNVDDKKCEIEKCDITNLDELMQIEISDVDQLLHLAAQSSGPNSFIHPQLDVQINILGTLNIIKWCKELKIRKIIFASSFVVYGDHPETEMLTEDNACNPKSVYGLSKLYCENLLKIYGEAYKIDWNVLRMFNVYGPGQDLTRTDQGMVSIFMNLILQSNHFEVQGSLNRFRDFIHIDDVVEGWKLCVEKGKPNTIYNLGSGHKTLLSSLITNLLEILDKKDQVTYQESSQTPGDILGCYADISKITRDLGFSPKFELYKGLKDMSDYVLSTQEN